MVPLEVGEFRSSFPLVALDPDRPILVVDHAHVDSLKHYLLGSPAIRTSSKR